MRRTAISTHIRARRPWLAWRLVLALLVLILLVHPAVMVIARHGHAISAAGARQADVMQVCAADSCMQAMLRLRAAVAQAVPRVPVTPLVVLALMALLSVAWRQSRPVSYRNDWCWPLARRRALLQVFLI